jgi:hypothetical protein
MYADPDAGHAVNAKSKNRNAAITFALWMGGTKGASRSSSTTWTPSPR